MDISILGCGWLGLPLAEHLKRQHYTVKGSTTSPGKISLLQQKQIEPYLIRLAPELENAEEVQSFWDTDMLILNIPPGRSRNNVTEYHNRQIQSVINQAESSAISHVIFISSTSVYPPGPGTVTEEDAHMHSAARASGNALLSAEKMLREATGFETSILRFGGLYGGDRHPAKYMAGRKNLGKAHAPVNLIHRDDCIAIISKIIDEDVTGEIFNAVCDGHPSRKEYYTAVCRSLGLEPPSFKQSKEIGNYKIVSNEKLKRILGYTFIHPEPLIPEEG